jgi:uncharacterized iron-regulated protein
MKIFSPRKNSLSAALLVALFASAAHAEILQAARDAQIVILGEQHDNPDHHKRQAEWVAALGPTALVFEMLAPAQEPSADETWETQAELDAILGWSATDWPSFDMYFPIFAAAPEAAVWGAGLTRADLQGPLEQPLSEHALARVFGLDQSADPQEQAARERLQADAHCGALPEEILPMMVDAQRLRDVSLANAALEALDRYGAPVVVITGNGHARADWGAPAFIAFAEPDVTVFTLAQGEEGGAVQGAFNLTLDATAPERGDPCAAFNR